MTFMRTGRPTNSMWGSVQHADELAPGIWAVSTAGHGGFMLSLQRQDRMPMEWRSTRHSHSAQYEEDCDWALPFVVFAAELDPRGVQLPFALRTIAAFHPDKLELARELAGVTA